MEDILDLTETFYPNSKRIEREKKMRQAKQNKEDEVKKNKAELVERMRKKEETSCGFCAFSLLCKIIVRR